MKNKTLPAYLQSQSSYNILGDLEVSISIYDNPLSIAPDHLFALVARKNLKRGFLFVSKVLGKHIPIQPYTGLMAGAILGALYMRKVYDISADYLDNMVRAFNRGENLGEAYSTLQHHPIIIEDAPIIIGFAETATALGHGLFQFFQEATYVHTTRENIVEKKSIVSFQEEHSHATNHKLYVLNENLLCNNAPVMLVDDEITTGKTALNLIEAIHNIYPRKVYSVVSLLDWRSQEHINRFKEKERELGIQIHTVSLLSGEMNVKGNPVISVKNSWKEACLTRENMEPQVKIHKLQKLGRFFQPILFSSVDEMENRSFEPYIKETGRFGIKSSERRRLEEDLAEIAQLMNQYRKGKRALCLGTEEFMYIPMRIASLMGDDVLYHSTTRSPIHAHHTPGYGIKNSLVFSCPYNPTVTNYLYNIPCGVYDDLFIFFERETEYEHLESLLKALNDLGIPNIHVIFCMGNEDRMAGPDTNSSFKKEDVIFVLKDLSNAIEEKGTEDREEAMQGGIHYSEMLPIEYKPTDEYMDLFFSSLEESAHKLAMAIGVVSQRILKQRGRELVLVSLARAGTPIGILIKRYFMLRYGLELPHYSISIIRGKGMDENALRYIIKKHPGREIQFIDGWTGKGAIAQVLREACLDFKEKYGLELNDDLAVLADPGHCVKTYGTREDFLIASSCLNSTVSGLVSRTVHRGDLIGEYDFHGGKYYKELSEEDVSNLFIETVCSKFADIMDKVDEEVLRVEEGYTDPTWKGWKDIEQIQKVFDIKDINLIKPGIGETTRVLLRRVPWKILIKDEKSPNLRHILLLAKDKNVPLEIYPDMTYECIGLIKSLGSD